MARVGKITTVKPPIKETLNKGQPLYKGKGPSEMKIQILLPSQPEVESFLNQYYYYCPQNDFMRFHR